MAFAPNNEVGTGRILGCFREADFGQFFEYGKPAEDEHVWETIKDEYPHKVWVGSHGCFRWGKVLKAVAYIVVDEGIGGEPVVEKWQIRKHRKYVTGV